MSDDTARPHLRLLRGDAPPPQEIRRSTPSESLGFSPTSGSFARMFDLTGRVALDVGGGLGATIATALTDFGARLAIADLDLSVASDLAARCDRPGIESLLVALDITNDASVTSTIEMIESRCGRIDILVNTAGINNRKPVTEYTPEDWRRILDTNLTGVF